MASGAAAAPVVQTVVLRVSIHCHGCKKKVRKVLKGIEGVQNVTVDALQHKVTVTGTVGANALIQRLYKSGKKGLPWNCHPPANKNEAAPAPEAPPAAPPTQPAGDGGKDGSAPAAAEKKQEEAVKEPQAEGSEKKQPEQEGGGAEKKPPGAESKGEEKAEAKKDGEAAEPPKAKAAEPAKEAVAAAAAAGKDEDEAKKSDKPPNKDAGKAAAAEPVVAMAERSLSVPLPPAPKYAYEEEYRHHPYYAPQPVVSYHAAQRSASLSYFAPQAQPAYSMQQQQPPPPAYSMHQQAPPQPAYHMQQQPQAQAMQQWSPSYLYTPYPHAVPESYYQDYYSPPGAHAAPPPMQDSYRIFDDENPNSCSVM